MENIRMGTDANTVTIHELQRFALDLKNGTLNESDRVKLIGILQSMADLTVLLEYPANDEVMLYMLKCVDGSY